MRERSVYGTVLIPPSTPPLPVLLGAATREMALFPCFFSYHSCCSMQHPTPNALPPDHVTPWIDYTPVPQTPDPLTLENLNFTLSTSLFLSMDDPAESPRPEWLYSRYGKPDPSGFSQSNLTVIAVNKTESIQSGVVDVFYFLFYSFNDGSDVGGQKYGNHVSVQGGGRAREREMDGFAVESPSSLFRATSIPQSSGAPGLSDSVPAIRPQEWRTLCIPADATALDPGHQRHACTH